MTDRIDLLDHGYVQHVETWGSDERIIEAARMSTGKGFLGWGPRCGRCGLAFLDSDGVSCRTRGTEGGVCQGGASERVAGDEKLLRYLYENKHHTPFEMAGATFEVQAPIFVFREWHRHRVPFGYNEASARYSPLPDLNYVPTVERLLINSMTNKQAGTVKGAEVLTEDGAKLFRGWLEHVYAKNEGIYQDALRMGVPKELARIHLPVGRYSKMRATSNLRGWLGFLTLRTADAAQYEIRVFANVVQTMLAERFPRTMALYAEPPRDEDS